ncbi:hypothetical protein [uncultured Mediterranean phage uvMED]|nr:hypothetical protein [uncultured Mediterranean phage uvMED]
MFMLHLANTSYVDLNFSYLFAPATYGFLFLITYGYLKFSEKEYLYFSLALIGFLCGLSLINNYLIDSYIEETISQQMANIWINRIDVITLGFSAIVVFQAGYELFREVAQHANFNARLLYLRSKRNHRL